MKHRFLIAVLASIISAPSLSSDFKPSFRMGIGFSQSDIQILQMPEYDFGGGVKIEAGYDINEILSAQASFERSEVDTLLGPIDGMTFKITSQIGYQFKISDSLFLKPYGVLGYASYREENPLNEYQAGNYVAGFGLRATLNSGAYASVEYNYSPTIRPATDLTQTSFVVGFKF